MFLNISNISTLVSNSQWQEMDIDNNGNSPYKSLAPK